MWRSCCARWARQTPRAVALICENERGDVSRFSYADLHHAALRLAAALVALLLSMSGGARASGDPGDVRPGPVDIGGGRTRLIFWALFPTAAERDRVAKEYGAVEGAKQTLGRLADYLRSLV